MADILTAFIFAYLSSGALFSAYAFALSWIYEKHRRNIPALGYIGAVFVWPYNLWLAFGKKAP